jgi:aspartate/methionine/tyrosine aminotransferase
MALEGIRADPDDVVVTVGSQMALDLVTRIYCDPGDIVLAEGPSYVGALGSFAAYQARVVHVGMDAHGLVPSLLRDACARSRPDQFLYTVPTFHNPAGVTLSLERRAKVLAICREYGVPVVEDNPYGLLGFSGHTYPALRSLDRDVVYLGSFSKTFASGLRVGWALVPPPYATGSCSRPSRRPSARRVSPRCWSRVPGGARLAQPGQDVHRGLPRAPRRHAPRAGELPPDGCTWNVPDGGFYVWLTVPEGVDTKAMLPRAVTARVAYASAPGSTPTVSAAASCGCRTATRRRSGSPKGSGGWPGAGGGARRAAHVRQPGPARHPARVHRLHRRTPP